MNARNFIKSSPSGTLPSWTFFQVQSQGRVDQQGIKFEKATHFLKKDINYFTSEVITYVLAK